MVTSGLLGFLGRGIYGYCYSQNLVSDLYESKSGQLDIS